MTDLLTKEEREAVEGVRHRWQHERSDSVDTGELLAIIDNLSKRRLCGKQTAKNITKAANKSEKTKSATNT